MKCIIAVLAATAATLTVAACGEGSLVIDPGSSTTPRRVIVQDWDGHTDQRHYDIACEGLGVKSVVRDHSYLSDGHGEAAIVTCKLPESK